MPKSNEIRKKIIPDFDPNDLTFKIVQMNIRVTKQLKRMVSKEAEARGWPISLLVESVIRDFIQEVNWVDNAADRLIKLVEEYLKAETIEDRIQDLSTKVLQLTDVVATETMGIESSTENRILTLERDLLYRIASGQKVTPDSISALESVAVDRLHEKGYVVRSEDGLYQLFEP